MEPRFLCEKIKCRSVIDKRDIDVRAVLPVDQVACFARVDARSDRSRDFGDSFQDYLFVQGNPIGVELKTGDAVVTRLSVGANKLHFAVSRAGEVVDIRKFEIVQIRARELDADRWLGRCLPLA